MLVIRFARRGRKNLPLYRIVVAEKARAATGKFVEILGNYNPHTKEVQLDKAAVEKRLESGARPSNSVARLLKKEGIKLPDWVEIEERHRAPKSEAKDEEDETSAEPTKDTPKEEAAAADDQNDKKEDKKEDAPDDSAAGDEKNDEKDEKKAKEGDKNTKES